MLGLSWNAFNPHLQEEKWKKEEEEEAPAVAMKKGTNGRAGFRV